MEDFKHNEPLDRLKRGIYSRKTPDIIDTPRSQFKKEEFETPQSWDSKGNSKFDALASRFAHVAEKRHTFAKKFLTITASLFVIAVAVAVYVFSGGVNTISSKNVDIEVVGPVSVGGGQNVSFDIKAINKNNTDLEAVKLTVEYPTGARSIDDLSKELTSQSFNLGTVESGDEGVQSVSLFLFGEKEEVKKFNIVVEYRVKNSSALFYKEKSHEISISSAPVIVTSTYPKEINSNQNINFSVEVASNSNENIEDFLLNVEYPFGFTFTNASPSPSFNNNTWKMSFKSGEKRVIRISGVLAGVDNEERVFKVSSGTASPDDERKIGVLFTSTNESIVVEKPFVGIDLTVGSSSGEPVVTGVSTVNGELSIINNLSSRLFNVGVEAALSGGAFSESSVYAGNGGFFRSVDDTILWDARSLSELGSLAPGEDVDLNFRFNPIAYQSIPAGTLSQIKVKIKVVGERVLDSGEPEKIELTLEKIVRLGTELSLVPKVVRVEGNIENTGPIPPRVDQKTTYAIVWSLANTFNAATGVEVIATLPSYVEWTGAKSPGTEDIVFDPISHQVIWRVPQIVAGAGYKGPAKQVAFQVALLPSVSQVGTNPEIIGPVTVRAKDKITTIDIFSNASALTTRFTDSSFKEGYDKVVQ
ncbi:MAG TPA: hypothetical protein VJH67_02530 [Candidatus Paceibacterota bacterium]